MSNHNDVDLSGIEDTVSELQLLSKRQPLRDEDLLSDYSRGIYNVETYAMLVSCYQQGKFSLNISIAQIFHKRT
jgi:hypothetical protein